MTGFDPVLALEKLDIPEITAPALSGKRNVNLPGLATLLNDAVSIAAHALGVEWSAIFVLDAEQASCSLRAADGLSQDMLARTKPVPISSNTAIAHALRTRESLIILNTTLERRFDASPWRGAGGSMLLTPILSETRNPLGCIVSGSRVPREFGPGDVTLSELLAAQTAHVLEWANRFEVETRRANELAHSYSFVTALGQISVRLLTSLEPEHVMRTLGLELKKLGLTCFVALLDSDTQTLAIEYLAIDSRALDVAEKLTGLTVRGFRMPYQRVSSFVEVLEQRRVVFITDVMDIGQTLLPSLPKPIFARVLRLAGATARSHAIYLPLAVEERVLGLLGIWGEGLEESDIAAASLLASQVAAALEVARLHQQAEVAAVMEERARLARELHDSMTQSLYSLTLFAEAARRQVTSGDLPLAQLYLTRMNEMAQQALKEMRLLVYHLRPALLSKEGLVNTLLQRLDAVEKRVGLETHLAVEGELELTPAVEEELYYVAQEALNNTLKHSGASRVDVLLRARPTTVELEIVDNGKGFDLHAPRDRGGMGLTTIQERAERMGGTAVISSEIGGGTRVQVKLNMPKSRPRDLGKRKK